VNGRVGHFEWQIQLRRWSDLVDDVLVEAAIGNLSQGDARVDELSTFCRSVAESADQVTKGTLLGYWLARALGWNRSEWLSLAQQLENARQSGLLVPTLEKLSGALHSQHRQINRRLRSRSEARWH
jgi:hypothetical protein